MSWLSVQTLVDYGTCTHQATAIQPVPFNCDILHVHSWQTLTNIDHTPGVLSGTSVIAKYGRISVCRTSDGQWWPEECNMKKEY